MDNSSTFHFTWGSAFGISVILFLVINFIYFLMGVVSPIMFRFLGYELSVKFGLAFSPGSDVVAFGKTAEEIMKDHPSALVLKNTVYYMFAGLYLAVTILQGSIIWFGLMRGQEWSLWALTGCNLAIISFYLVAARNFSSHLAPLGFSDLMPYAIIPGIILPVASILGFIGMNSK